MNIKILFIGLSIILSNVTYAFCNSGERACGADGYLLQCARLSSALNDYDWRSTQIKCTHSVNNERICEPGFERCSPDGVIQKCAFSGERWQTQPYRNCKPGNQITIEKETIQ